MDKKELANQISDRYEAFAEADYTLNVEKIKEAMYELKLLFFGRYFTEDAIDREALLDSIRGMASRGISVIFITHRQAVLEFPTA